MLRSPAGGLGLDEFWSGNKNKEPEFILKFGACPLCRISAWSEKDSREVKITNEGWLVKRALQQPLQSLD
jgi:hypothetical protein